MPKELFEKGNPGGPGRDKGSQNKVTKDLVKGVLGVLDEIGGWEGMIEWVEGSPKRRETFYGWVMKMLPSNVNLDSNEGLHITIGPAFQPKGKDDKNSNIPNGS